VRLWRISNHTDLRGVGGLRAPARWHNRGRPIVYLAESPPGALIEILVHQDVAWPAALPDTYRLLTIETGDLVPADLVSPNLVPIDGRPLPADWIHRPETTRAMGDDWLAQGASALLWVPSAIMPGVRNVLFNPLHPDGARLRIVDIQDVPFDPRLFKPMDS
jgi:RES domain-containing protein